MIVIEFIATCRPHDLQERVQIRGKDTPRQLQEGYTELDRKMRQKGCDDYSSVHSVTKQSRDAHLPHLFSPHYPELDKTQFHPSHDKWTLPDPEGGYQ